MHYGKTFFLGVALLSAGGARAASVRADVPCPIEPLESCRWEVLASQQGGTVRVHWEKSLVSRHRGQPLARPLRCNVDRGFDHAAGGYIRVWFRNEAEPCDAMRARAPSDCGVRFLLDVPGQLTSARGFEVTAPTGRTLDRVEHYSTLHLQCGDFAAGTYARHTWRSRVGWRAGGPDDGTYSQNAEPALAPRP